MELDKVKKIKDDYKVADMSLASFWTQRNQNC
jgi:hypothetical protein